PAAGPAVDRRRDTAPVQQQDRPPTSVRDRAELGQEWRGERVAPLSAEVDEPHVWQRGADANGPLQVLQSRPPPGTGRRAAVRRNRPRERRSLRSDGARVVAGVGVLLVRGVVLLVEDDQTDVAHRREQRGPRADDDASGTGGDPIALITP